ncbi:MAG: hypothetical protein ABIG44_13970 [Planctomycetota bacterium]
MTQRWPLCGSDRYAIGELRSGRRVKGNCDDLLNTYDTGCFIAAVGHCPPNPDPYECAPCDCLRGDINGDGYVNSYDISGFVLSPTSTIQHEAAYPNCDINNGDMNDDGEVDTFDINPFVDRFTGN